MNNSIGNIITYTGQKPEYWPLYTVESLFINLLYKLDLSDEQSTSYYSTGFYGLPIVHHPTSLIVLKDICS